MASTLPKIIANFETTLSAKLTAAGTSLSLTSNTDSDGNTLAAGIYAFTINEGKPNEEHVIGTLSGTTVSSLTRNLSRSNGTTAQTGKEHRKGSSIKITNHPALARIIRVLQGTDALNGAAPLKYDAHPTFNANEQLVDKQYVDGVAIAGSPDSSTSVKGIGRISVAPVSSTIPIFVGDNDPRLPTQDENNALAGNSGTAVSTSNKLIDAADVAENAASKIVRRKSDLNITVPTTPTASTDAASKAYAESAAIKKISIITADATSPSNTTETNLISVTVPGGTLGTANGVRLKAYLSSLEMNANGDFTLRCKYGGATLATLTLPSGSISGGKGFIEFLLLATGAANTQEGSGLIFATPGGVTSSGAIALAAASGASGVDSTADQTLLITTQAASTSPMSAVLTMSHTIIEKIS